MKNFMFLTALLVVSHQGVENGIASDIYSVERDGVHWIMSKSELKAAQISPVSAIDQAKCDEMLTEIGSVSRMEYCRQDPDDLMCPRFIAKEVGIFQSFGIVFSRTKDPRDIEPDATTLWKISDGGVPNLDPALLDQYASQLGLDPKKSAVAFVRADGVNLAKDTEELRLKFRTPDSTEHEGFSYAWMFQERFQILNDPSLYIRQTQENTPVFALTSYVLNCELSRGANDYIDVVVDATATGIRYHSPEVVDAAFKAYQELAAKEIPVGMTNEERSLMYGYYLARSFPAELVESIGLTNLAAMLFDQPEGKVTLKKLATKEQLNDAISIVGTHVNRNQTIRLTKTP